MPATAQARSAELTQRLPKIRQERRELNKLWADRLTPDLLLQIEFRCLLQKHNKLISHIYDFGAKIETRSESGAQARVVHIVLAKSQAEVNENSNMRIGKGTRELPRSRGRQG